MEKNWPVASQPIALLVIFLLSWGIASSQFPGLVYANSAIMRIVLLIIGAQACGYLVSFIGLPGEWVECDAIQLELKLLVSVVRVSVGKLLQPSSACYAIR